MHPGWQIVLLTVELQIDVRCQPSDWHWHVPLEIYVLAQQRVQRKRTTFTKVNARLSVLQ
jgi:hypothetical protein